MKNGTSNPFSKGVVIGMVATGIVSFALAFVLSIFGEDLSSPRSAGRDAFSISAVGHSVWVELMREYGLEADLLRSETLPRDGSDRPVMILEPQLDPSPARTSEPFESLYMRSWEADFSAPLIVAFPKWRSYPGAGNPGHVEGVRLDRVDDLRAAFNQFLDGWDVQKISLRTAAGYEDWECSLLGEGSYRLSMEAPRYFDPDTLLDHGDGWNWEPVVTCDDRAIVLRSGPDSMVPPIYLIADADLFNNHGIDDGDHAQLMLDLVTETIGAKAVYVDETIHGYRRDGSLFAELFRFPIVLALLHGLLSLGVFLWAGGSRFGSPLIDREIRPDGRKMLIDNSARLLVEGRYAGDSLKSYLRQAIRRVARHRGQSARMDADDTLQRLQLESDARGLKVNLDAWRKEIEALPSGRHTTTDKMLRLAERIHAWREEMTDGNRTHR